MEQQASINVYLNFSGKCREAMEFYHRTIGGELNFMTVKDAGMAGQFPEALHNNIVHASLQNGSMALMGSDLGNAANEIEGNTISLSVICTSEQQHSDLYEGLSAGATNLVPPHNFPQGKMAALTDKYGKAWMFYYDNRG